MDHDLDLNQFDSICRLFPLPGVVLFPHAVMPLHIFEPRYRQMTEHALANDRLVTMVQIQGAADWQSQEAPPLESVACVGRIINHERLPDGRFNFLLLGLRRVRLTRELSSETLYRQAEVEVLDDVPSVLPEEPQRDELVGLFRRLADLQGGLDPDLAHLLDSEPSLGLLTDILGHALGLPPHLKQKLLNETHVERRATDLIGVLNQVLTGTFERPFPPPFSRN